MWGVCPGTEARHTATAPLLESPAQHRARHAGGAATSALASTGKGGRELHLEEVALATRKSARASPYISRNDPQVKQDPRSREGRRSVPSAPRRQGAEAQREASRTACK